MSLIQKTDRELAEMLEAFRWEIALRVPRSKTPAEKERRAKAELYIGGAIIALAPLPE